MITHLSPDELIDVVENTAPTERAAHAQACPACGAEAAHLRAALAQARDVDAHEPSPLFWDHVSARVREAVAAERTPAPSSRRPWLVWLASAGVAAAVVFAVVVSGPRPTSSDGARTPADPAAISANAGGVENALPALPDDPEWEVVLNVAASVSWDPADNVLALQGDSTEHALWNLSDAERREMKRLIEEEIGRKL